MRWFVPLDTDFLHGCFFKGLSPIKRLLISIGVYLKMNFRYRT